MKETENTTDKLVRLLLEEADMMRRQPTYRVNPGLLEIAAHALKAAEKLAERKEATGL